MAAADVCPTRPEPTHQPESLDWFNVLIAQTIAQFRSDAQHDDAILTSLTKALNGTTRPDFLDEIKGARLQARMDVDLSDMITLALETKMLLNYPKRLTAVLPVALGRQRCTI
ncbi:hypothetical protein PG994_008963 [Apiospora phragmitis]|uniref:SMP-LTD domain-containing protein n=1 Tax=Apiospora phragmitis TaxID=2905665 RepID=A0ABR1UHY3_9PEZI